MARDPYRVTPCCRHAGSIAFRNRFPRLIAPMDAINPCPDAISFRALAALHQHALVETDGASQEPLEHPALQELQGLLEQYGQLSQRLLAELNAQAPALKQQRSARQLMALGALQAHLQMGLRALVASEE